MKNISESIAVGLALATSGSPFAAGVMGNMDMSDSSAQQGGHAIASMENGEVKKVDTPAGKLTIKAGPIASLGMAAMTMAYNVKDPAMLSEVKVGDKIDFIAE